MTCAITRGISVNAGSDSAGLGWGLKFYISSKLPSDADATGLGPTL